MRALQSYLWLTSILIVGCSQLDPEGPVVTNSSAPGMVTNVEVVNKHGKATVTYTLPSDKDLSYVKAVYETSPGEPKEVLASQYTNTIILDGFGDTMAHNVELYAVNSSGKVSEPVNITIKPLTPGYIIARKSLKIEPDFGGFKITCQNPVNDNLAIIPMVDTAGNGKWVQTIGMENVYSKDTVITAVIHNQPSIPRNYGFVVRDEWSHYSDTLVVNLTPIFEKQLNKDMWSVLELPNDAQIINNGGWCYEYYMWDGDEHPGWPRTYFTEESAAKPQTATIDLGAKHTFSRIKINPYLEVGSVYYVRGNPKDFQIWGSNNPDRTDPPDITSDPTWHKLMTCHVTKPSGSPYNTETSADQAKAYEGWEFAFPTGISKYRYIRIRSLSNWQGSYFICIAELTLWGN